MNGVVYTIGHSNHDPETLLRLLVQAGVEVLVDVRSNPGSQWVSHVNRPDLERLVSSVGIRYMFLGDTLGGKPNDQDCYDALTGKPDYEAIQGKQYFKQGLLDLLETLKQYRVCIMCAEENPATCHRNLLVAEALRRAGVRILHVRGSGQIQTDDDLWKEKAGVAPSQLALPM